MTKQNQNNLLSALQIACEQFNEVRVFTETLGLSGVYAHYVSFYTTDRAVTTFEKTLHLLNSGVKGLYEVEIEHYNKVCKLYVK